MTTPTITLAGHVLNDHFSITDLSRPFPPSRVSVEEVPGRHGVAYRSRTMGSRSLSLRLWAFSRDHSDLVDDMATLASWIWGEGAGLLTLVISDEGGRVRKVVPEGELPFDEYVERGNCLLTLTQPDPICDLGSPKTSSLSSGGTKTITVGGTHPAALTVTASAAKRNSTSHVWGVQVDSGDVLQVELPDSSTHAVSIDCANRIVTVDSATSMATLASDWPELWPGEHTIQMTQGTGAATLTWQERSV